MIPRELEVKEPPTELLARVPVEVFTDLVSQLEEKDQYEKGLKNTVVYLVGVLAGSRHPHSPGPVEVHVGQFVTAKKKM